MPVLNRSIAFTLLVELMLAIPALAAITVATGDSLTNAYFLQVVGNDWHKVAIGGTNARQFVGLDPGNGGVTRDFVADTLALSPDTIVFLLGTNDALRPDTWFHDEYVPLVTGVFDAYTAAGVDVVVVTPIPIIRPGLEAAGQRLADLYRPWLMAEAAARGFYLLDLWSEIQILPSWQLLYNDGVHLYANGRQGFVWMAAWVEFAAQAVMTPPPPATGQSRAQQKCSVRISAHGARIAQRQGWATLGCIGNSAIGAKRRLGRRSQVKTAQACLTNDPKRRMRKAIKRLRKQDKKHCRKRKQRPRFGYGGKAAVISESLGASLRLTENIFGSDLDVALIVANVDAEASQCQRVAQAGTHALFDVLLNRALVAKAMSLRGGGLSLATDQASLGASVRGFLSRDPGGEIVASAAALGDNLAVECAGVSGGSLVGLFPGSCSGAAGALATLSICFEQVARCEACKALNGVNGLGIDCDRFDDNLANSSCR